MFYIQSYCKLTKTVSKSVKCIQPISSLNVCSIDTKLGTECSQTAEMLHADCLIERKLSQQFIKMMDWWRNRTAEADASLLQETCIFLLNNFSTFMKKHMTKFWSCGRWGKISEFYIETTEFLTALWISLPKFASLNVFFFFHWRMWPVVIRNHLHAVQMCRVQFHIFCPNNWIWHL